MYVCSTCLIREYMGCRSNSGSAQPGMERLLLRACAERVPPADPRGQVEKLQQLQLGVVNGLLKRLNNY